MNENDSASNSDEASGPAQNSDALESYFPWTSEQEFRLAKLIHQKLAFMRTKKESFKTKYQMVLAELQKREEFIDLKISPMGLQNKFNRMTKSVLDKYGFTKASANLSGLKQQPPPFEELIITMAQQAENVNKKAKYGKEGKKTKKKVLNSIVSNQMQNSSVVGDSFATTTPSTNVSSAGITSLTNNSNNSGMSGKLFSAKYTI